MEELILNPGQDLNGLRTIVMENRFVRVVVLPQAGAKIWQIHYKPLNADLLWNHPGELPAQHRLGACYDDVWTGGWDELFPNDEPGTLMETVFPDHGELWTGAWTEEYLPGGDEVGVHLSYTTPISKCLAEKSLRLRPENATLEVRYRLTNTGAKALPFLFKLHPAFAVSENHRIDFPPMTVIREPEFPGTLGEAPVQFPWPYARLHGQVLDLRKVPDVSSHAVYFFYGTGIVAGWCGVTNRAHRLAAAVRFDPKFFSSCWLFATYGGWRDLNVAVLEPATGYSFKIQSLIDGGRARLLSPGESLETTVLFSAQDGLSSIGGVEEDGRILPGDEN